MAITPIDQIDLNTALQPTSSSDATFLFSFLQNTAGIPFTEMLVTVLMVIIFVAMKENNQDTLESATATLWLGAIVSGGFLAINLISDVWLVSCVALALACTFGLYYRQHS